MYPGLGWVVWAKAAYLPEDLIFSVSYLGGNMPTLALNFSRPGAQVLLQYYNFLRLGREGYRRVQQACKDVALGFAARIAEMPAFEVLADGSDMPLVTWTLADGYTDKWDLHDLSEKLRARGWQVPAYPMPADIEDMTVMRIVVRNGVSHDLVGLLLDDLRNAVEYLDSLEAPMPKEQRPNAGFHH